MTPAQMGVLATRLELAASVPGIYGRELMTEAAAALRTQESKAREVLEICEYATDAVAGLEFIAKIVQAEE